jgi:aldehyde:ferredoxin oxidoreductase
MSAFGYAGEILKVGLSDGNITRLSTADYADRFLGGRGISAKIYWDAVSPQTKALDAENCLVYANGPVAGFTRLAGCRWTICGKSASSDPEAFSYANLGGSWGTWLKYAGYDGLAVQGKADKPVYLYLHDGKVEIKDATYLWGKNAFETTNSLKAELGKGVRVLTIGQAAENLISFATILADEGSSGSGGLGSVMGSKKLKAIAVAGNKRPSAADPERLQNLADLIYRMGVGAWFRDPLAPVFHTRPHACYGCVSGCLRESYQGSNGNRYKFLCQPIFVYSRPAMRYYNGVNEVITSAIRLCDMYGLDTCVMQPMIEWLIRCYKEGILQDKETGLPLSKIGSTEFIETLTRKIAFREGFGDILAQGTIKAAESVGKRAEEQISYSVVTRANETKDYDPRLIPIAALLLATEPRRPISQLHDMIFPFLRWLQWRNEEKGTYFSTEVFRNIAEKFWGGAIAADFSTYEGKALAAKKIQDRTCAKESLVLCDMIWPISYLRDTEDHVGDPTLESQIYSAVTGKELDEAGLNKIGERIYNLQRAILTRQGWGGRKGDRLLDYLHEEPIQYVRFNRQCEIPGRNGEITSRKGAVVEREEFEKMKSEYYELRGWNVETGLPTAKKLQELELGDVASDLEENGLLV